MFSPNMLKTFQTCPYKYWLKYVEQISVPQRASFFEKGKKIHALANYYLRGDDITKLEKTLNFEEQKIWEQLKNNEYFQKTYVNSEYNLSCKIGEYWIGGRLDAVVKDNSSTKNDTDLFASDNSETSHTQQPDISLPSYPPTFLPSNSAQSFSEGIQFFILDYKTGSIPKNPEYDFQTMVYLLALNASITSCVKLASSLTPAPSPNLGEGWGEVNFVYIDLKNNQNYLIKLTPENIKEYEQTIIKTCDEITNFTPQQNVEHTKKCEFCEYKKICM